jgi:hypothetical protein
VLLFGGIILKYGRHFDCWNHPQNMRMHVCYLDYHEAGLCWYLVIHTENLIRPLQLFYFHFGPIYWLSLVCTMRSVIEETWQHRGADTVFLTDCCCNCR